MKNRILIFTICFFLSGQAVFAGGFRSQLVPESPGKVNTETPSRSKAFFLSFLAPGLGEYYAGSKKWARAFAITELTLWAGFASFRIYGSWKQEDSRLFATAHAGVDVSGKDDQYFVNIENFMNTVEYNDFKLKERNIDALYPENEAYTWNWDSETSRAEYEAMRVSADRAKNNSMIVVAAIVLNHIVSGVDAIRVANKQSSMMDKGVQVGFVPLRHNGMALIVTKSF